MNILLFATIAWQVVYGSLVGCEGRAVELLTSELGDLILRDDGVYATSVLPCLPADSAPAAVNSFIIGTLADNPELARRLQPADVPAGGYLVRTLRENDRDLVLLAGDSPRETIYAAADFLSDGLVNLSHTRGNGLIFPRDLFDRPLAHYKSRRAPEAKVRSVFTWGHPIDDFREYFRNLAKLRLNRVYLWNDFPPLNAREVVDYAHSWGIEVFWGFPWGWNTAKLQNDVPDLAELERLILDDWRRNWRDLPGDGIYFQTFTEHGGRMRGNETVAERAVRLVNSTAAKILAEKPSLRIVFGLHAQSVKNDLAVFAAVDPRLELLWEDNGGFPYSLSIKTEPADDTAFTDRLLSDAARPLGIVWKSQLMQDWKSFTHQQGPYLLGVTSRRTYDADVAMQTELWKNYDHFWLTRFSTAYEAARLAHSKGPAVEMNLAAQLNGPIRLPTQLTAELFWSSSEPLETILTRVLRRNR